MADVAHTHPKTPPVAQFESKKNMRNEVKSK